MMIRKSVVTIGRTASIAAISYFFVFLLLQLTREPIIHIYISHYKISEEIFLKEYSHQFILGSIVAPIAIIVFLSLFISLWRLSRRIPIIKNSLSTENLKEKTSILLKIYFWPIAVLNLMGAYGIYMEGESNSSSIFKDALMAGVLAASYCFIYKVKIAKVEIWRGITALYCVSFALDLLTDGTGPSSLGAAISMSIFYCIFYLGPAALAIKYSFNSPQIWDL
ncbi:MAG: hypothetical protein PSX71_12235 [bacterium]|nr:hypothetical protein [bacterium]